MLLDISLPELQSIAKAGNASKHGVKIGDKLLIDNVYTATIVTIGDDYITCITTLSSAMFPYYVRDCVNLHKTSAIVGYPNSNLKSIADNFLKTLSDEFKSIVKDTTRIYPTCLLHFDDRNHSYSQTFYGFKELTEKLFIPDKKELLAISKFICGSNTRINFWTSTPYFFYRYFDNKYSTGQFDVCQAPTGFTATFAGFTERSICLMFNIG